MRNERNDTGRKGAAAMRATEAAKEARRAYKRRWAKENPDKIREQQRRYWERQAARMKEQEAQGEEGGKA